MCIDEIFTLTLVEEMWGNEEFSKDVHVFRGFRAYMFIIYLMEVQIVSKYVCL
jgi:hypothetical protein